MQQVSGTRASNVRSSAGFTSSLPFRYSVISIVHSTKFRTTLPLPGLSSFRYSCFRDCGCGRAMSFDGFFRDLFRKAPQTPHVRTPRCDPGAGPCDRILCGGTLLCGAHTPVPPREHSRVRRMVLPAIDVPIGTAPYNLVLVVWEGKDLRRIPNCRARPQSVRIFPI